MPKPSNLSCCLIGGDSLLLQCAELLLKRGHRIIAVISAAPQVRSWAHEKGLTILDAAGDYGAELAQQRFDYLFSIVHLALIPAHVLRIPVIGAINFHDGPLPGYAGLNAPTWALMRQEREHGITWHRISAGVDEGDILLQRRFPISPDETSLSLNARCFEAGLDCFAELVDQLAHGRVQPRPQDLSRRSYFGRHDRPEAAAVLDWQRPATELDALVRALDFGRYRNPLATPKLWHGATVVSVRRAQLAEMNGPPGTVLSADAGSLLVAAGTGALRMTQFATLSGDALTADEVLSRLQLQPGDILRAPDSTARESLTRANSLLARSEAFWIRQLVRLQPIELPWAKVSTRGARGRPHEFLEVALPPSCQLAACIAAFALYLEQICRCEDLILGFGHAELATLQRDAGSIVAPRALLDLSRQGAVTFVGLQDRISLSLTRACKSGTWARDVFAREPVLRGTPLPFESSALDIGVELCSEPESFGPRERDLLILAIDPEAKRCRLAFDSERLSRLDAERFRGGLQALLAKLVVEPDTVADRLHDAVLDDVDVLTDDERRLLFPPESSAYHDGRRPPTVIEWFERQTHKTPTAPAIVHGGATTTYADLRDRVRRIDAALRSRGVAPGDLVGVCMRRSVDLVAALLATMRVGAAYVPIDPHHPSDRISLILEDASPRVLLVDGETAKGLNVRWRDRVLPIAAALAFAPDDPPPVPRATSTNVAYVIFTSGSTGRPKGVRVLHHGLSTFLDAMTQEPGLARDDRLVAVTTVSFDIAGLELYLPLVNGATVVLADAETAMNAEELARLIDSAKATVFQATPATFRMLLQAGWKGRAGLKVLCGGEALPAELAEALLPRVASLWNVYGPTETTIWSTLHRVRPGDRPIPIGRSIRGTQTFVLGSRGKPVPIGCIGELNIGGDGVAEGYHGRDDLTRERFVPNPFSSVPNARMYRTGDLVRVLPDGLLAYVGRADFQVKVRGFRIELGEIESVLTARPEVREAVVVARPDASGEFGLVGYFVPSRAGVDVGELREHLRAKLPTYMVPPQLVGLDALPLTPNGKIDRKALPAPTGGAAAETSGDYEPPKSDVEVRLAAMWEDLLGLKRVGVAQSFFDVGGHSLLAVRLTSRIREELGVPIELVQIFRTPTIRGLADAIGGRALVGGSSVVPLRRGATGAPLVCLCGIALYQRLALAIGGDRPVLGVYIPEEGEMLDRIARGDGGGPSAQVLAASYFRAIQSERGMAPLRLLGFCFGGILAFEVAKLARTAGVEVELLALVDSPLWSRMRRARTKQAAIHARRLLREGPGYLVERFAERRAAGEAQSADAVPDEVARLNALATRSRSYVPTGTYGGRAVVVRTDDESIYGTWRRTRLLGWEGILTGPVETLGLSSHHQELLTGETAAEIGRWLSERP